MQRTISRGCATTHRETTNITGGMPRIECYSSTMADPTRQTNPQQQQQFRISRRQSHTHSFCYSPSCAGRHARNSESANEADTNRIIDELLTVDPPSRRRSIELAAIRRRLADRRAQLARSPGSSGRLRRLLLLHSRITTIGTRWNRDGSDAR